ncbi:hypothetical protein SGRIM128S_06341 [Streptomyces griseomycini]
MGPGKQERDLEVEGKKKRPRKQPYFVTPADGSVFAMAGLYEFWRDRTLPDDHPQAWWVTCSVITTEAETSPLAVSPADGPRTLADIHPRMPLMLTPDRWDSWLDPSRTDVEDLRGLPAPPPPGLMRAYPVSTAVSNVRNNGPGAADGAAPPRKRAHSSDATRSKVMGRIELIRSGQAVPEQDVTAAPAPPTTPVTPQES